jgi:hypothetical protein
MIQIVKSFVATRLDEVMRLLGRTGRNMFFVRSPAGRAVSHNWHSVRVVTLSPKMLNFFARRLASYLSWI